MDNVLITGACGHIGSLTVQALMIEGYKVYGIDLIGKEFPSNIQLPNGLFELIQYDLLDKDIENVIPNNIEYVIHLAGLSSMKDSFENPLDYEKVNVEGTINLLMACKRKKIRKFVFVSTFAVYGHFRPEINQESHPTNPLTPYGISKISAEMYVHILASKYNFDTLVLRLANVYGAHEPQEHVSLISSFVASARRGEDIVVYGDGKHRRSFLHVSDAARCLINAIQVDTNQRLTIDICDSVSYEIQDVARLVVDLIGNSNVNVKYNDSNLDLARNGNKCKS